MGDRFKTARIGNYKLTGLTLGTGSYSVVYEAKDVRTKKSVALKMVNTEVDLYVKRNYKREAYILSLLNHEHVIKMFEVFDSPKQFILVLELVPENLCDYVRSQKHGKIDEAMTRILFRQIIAAVGYIHEKGIIHRDIKLENLLIDTTKLKIKLTDFGLSNQWDMTNRLTVVCGSPEYSSPELHEGKAYGNEIDVWALGVVLFAMVVGRLPFDVSHKKPVSNRHRRDLFLDETRHGITTVKHQRYMSSTSKAFRDLTSKLLNPDQMLRIKINEVERHDWLVLGKVDISRVKCLNNSSNNATPSSYSRAVKPSTAQIYERAPRNIPQRPSTQAERHQELRATLQSRLGKVKY